MIELTDFQAMILFSIGLAVGVGLFISCALGGRILGVILLLSLSLDQVHAATMSVQLGDYDSNSGALIPGMEDYGSGIVTYDETSKPLETVFIDDMTTAAFAVDIDGIWQVHIYNGLDFYGDGQGQGLLSVDDNGYIGGIPLAIHRLKTPRELQLFREWIETHRGNINGAHRSLVNFFNDLKQKDYDNDGQSDYDEIINHDGYSPDTPTVFEQQNTGGPYYTWQPRSMDYIEADKSAGRWDFSIDGFYTDGQATFPFEPIPDPYQPEVYTQGDKYILEALRGIFDAWNNGVNVFARGGFGGGGGGVDEPDPESPGFNPDPPYPETDPEDDIEPTSWFDFSYESLVDIGFPSIEIGRSSVFIIPIENVGALLPGDTPPEIRFDLSACQSEIESFRSLMHFGLAVFYVIASIKLLHQTII